MNTNLMMVETTICQPYFNAIKQGNLIEAQNLFNQAKSIIKNEDMIDLCLFPNISDMLSITDVKTPYTCPFDTDIEGYSKSIRLSIENIDWDNYEAYASKHFNEYRICDEDRLHIFMKYLNRRWNLYQTNLILQHYYNIYEYSNEFLTESKAFQKLKNFLDKVPIFNQTQLDINQNVIYNNNTFNTIVVTINKSKNGIIIRTKHEDLFIAYINTNSSTNMYGISSEVEDILNYTDYFECEIAVSTNGNVVFPTTAKGNTDFIFILSDIKEGIIDLGKMTITKENISSFRIKHIHTYPYIINYVSNNSIWRKQKLHKLFNIPFDGGIFIFNTNEYTIKFTDRHKHKLPYIECNYYLHKGIFKINYGGLYPNNYNIAVNNDTFKHLNQSKNGSLKLLVIPSFIKRKSDGLVFYPFSGKMFKCLDTNETYIIKNYQDFVSSNEFDISDTYYTYIDKNEFRVIP